MKKKQVVALLASTALAVSVTSGCSCSNTAVETEETIALEETAEPIEEVEETPVEEEEPVVSENTVEIEDTAMQDIDPADEVDEEVQEENITAPWEPVMYDEPLTMYAKKTCNVRSGPSTSYDKVNSLSWAQEVVVIGEATYEDSTWYILEYSNLDTQEYQMVASSLLQDTKPQAQAPAPQQQSTQPQQQQQPSGGGNACSDSPCPDCADCSDCPTYSGGCNDSLDDVPTGCWDCPDASTWEF